MCYLYEISRFLCDKKKFYLEQYTQQFLCNKSQIFSLNIFYIFSFNNLTQTRTYSHHHSLDEPCTSGTTPIISHCPTIIGESSSTGVTVMQRMQKSNSEDSSLSESSSIVNEASHQQHGCHT